MISDLKKLDGWRDALLLAQAGALLHNMGKITPQFLNKMTSINKDQKFRYQHILRLIEEDYLDLEHNINKLYNDLQEPENQNVLGYLFSWDEIQENDNGRLIEFLNRHFNIEWVKTAKIEKNNDNRGIKVSNGSKILLLSLNDEKTKIYIKIDDDITYEFIAKTENDKLNIYVSDTETVYVLKRRFTLPRPFNDRYYRPGDLIEYLGQGNQKPGNELYSKSCLIKNIFQYGSRLTHLMNRSHGGASGGEKQDIYTGKQTDPDKLYKSTPFGWESAAPNLNDTNNHKYEIEKIIQNHISPDIKSLNFDSFANQLRPYLEASIADSQRPINDITVWDIGHSGMAFLLTQAIGMIIQRRDIDHDEFAKNGYKNTLFWRVLSVRLDGLAYLKTASSLADLRVRHLLLQKTLKCVRSTLEGMPVAIEVYRDENGSFYMFPDLPEEHQFTKYVRNLLQSKLIVDGISLNCILSKRLVNHPNDKEYLFSWDKISGNDNEKLKDFLINNFGINWIKESIIEKTDDDRTIKVFTDNNYLSLRLNDKKSEVNLEIDDGRTDELITNIENSSLQIYKGEYIGKYISEQIEKEVPINSDMPAYIAPWQSTKNKEICVACGIRPQGYGAEHISDYQTNPYFYAKKARGRNICCICMDRRIGVSERWATKDLQDSTVWIDEVADKNGRVALVVGQFDIQNWEMWYPKEVKHSLKMVKSQSFARIRRVWETTKNFWQDILPTKEDTEIRISEGGRILGLAGPRLKIEGELSKSETLGRYHAYELSLHSTKLNVVWVPKDNGKNGYFITSKNSILVTRLLEKILPEQNKSESITEYQERLHEWAAKTLEKEISGTLTIEEPTGYGSQNKIWGSIKIEKVEQIPDSEYTPAIPILAEPRTFMALVPADKALDLVTKINEKYEREMGKVRNRLPLHTGIVFAPHKTPLRTILDAGRRMMVEKTISVDGWEVVEKECLTKDDNTLPEYLLGNPHFTECVRLKLTRDNHIAVWHVPLSMGDGTKDNWYPYVFVQPDKDGNPPSGRKRMFETPCPWNLDTNNNDTPQPTWLVHAKDIKEHDVIYFTPSTLDFQWLDTSGRRFEIDYDNEGRRRDMPQRPYMLNDLNTLQDEIWGTLKKHLSSSQIHALYELIETKRYEWKVSDSKEFRKFCCDAIVNLEWKKLKLNGSNESVYPWKTSTKQPEDDWLKQWADYAVYGWLSDVIELYMKVLKEKPETKLEERI